jgi:ethanolamine ammonia-lyase small subunit
MSDLIPKSRLSLRDFTSARVSLPTTGNSIATTEVLDFQLAHARARDAVHALLDLPVFARRLEVELPVLKDASVPVFLFQTNALDRASYLRRPDLGRTLHLDSVAKLQPGGYDLAITIADGLSALAVERNAIPVLAHLLPRLLDGGWGIAPLTLVQQGRVAIGDPIGFHLGARLGLVLIGERPGLSSPDSLGAYLTWNPCPERTDADRNCLSNIREGGLAAGAAADRLFWYLRAARVRQMSGTSLKEGLPETGTTPALPEG